MAVTRARMFVPSTTALPLSDTSLPQTLSYVSPDTISTLYRPIGIAHSSVIVLHPEPNTPTCSAMPTSGSPITLFPILPRTNLSSLYARLPIPKTLYVGYRLRLSCMPSSPRYEHTINSIYLAQKDFAACIYFHQHFGEKLQCTIGQRTVFDRALYSA